MSQDNTSADERPDKLKEAEYAEIARARVEHAKTEN